MSNSITAFFKGRTGVAESVYQYDYGKILIIDGLNLPATFEVHFTTISEEDAITVIGQNNRVAIPDSCISIPGTVTAYIYLHSGDNDGETEYVIKFAVIRRAKPDYDEDEKTNWETAASQALAMLQNSRKVNTPLDAYNQVNNGTAGQLLRTKGNGATEWVNVGLPTDEQTAEAVNAWLDEHPEATTTVQDGSLTESKFTDTLKLKTIKEYVTPEMFGAVGDGITDDTDAITNAFNSGKVVVGTQKYKFSVYGNADTETDLVLKGGTYIGTMWCKSLIAEDATFIHSLDNLSSVLVRINDADKCDIRSCVFDAKNSTCEVLLSVKGENITVQNCIFKDNAGRGGLGIRSSNNVIVTNNIVNHIGGYGIELFDVCKNVIIEKNIITECNYVLWGDGTGTDGCISTYGDTTGTGTTQSENINICNNIIIYTLGAPGGSGTGIRINGVKKGKVIGNLIYAGDLYSGIFVQNRKHGEYIVVNENIDIENNYIHGAGVLIRLLQCINIRIKGNTLIHTSDANSANTVVFGNGGDYLTGILEFSSNYVEQIGTGSYLAGFYGTNDYDTIMKDNTFECNRAGEYKTKTFLAIGNIFHNKMHNWCINIALGVGVVANNIYGYKGHSSGSLHFATPADFTDENNINDGSLYEQ